MFYLLPGMGATRQMYQGAWLKLSGVTYVDWPQYRGEKSLSEVADRLIREHGITANDWIGGSSLGGMVAVEIYKKLKNTKVVLIGSALAPQEIRPLLKLLAPLATVTPIRLIQLLTKSSGNDTLQMFSAADPAFIRAMCIAASKWEGYTGNVSPILRLHGEHDPVIPCPKDAEVIKGAGHLVAMTHSDDCVRIISRLIFSFQLPI